MDEIIYLEPDEEITSVIDKIKKAQSTNLGLVIPRDATLLQSVVNLRLLSREANSLGKKISVVTADKIGRNLAARIGLPVFASIEEKTPIFQPTTEVVNNDEVLEVEPEESALPENSGFKVQHYQAGSGEINRSMPKSDIPESQTEESPHSVNWNRHEKPVFKNRPSGGHSVVPTEKSSINSMLGRKDKEYKNLHKIIWPIVAVFIILCLAATYFLLPKATVTVFVPSENLQKDLTLSISDQVKVANVENSVLPGALISAESSKDGKFSTTGKKDIGTKAAGTITIYNNLDTNTHNFTAGTKLASSNQTFVLKSAVQLPAAQVQSLSPLKFTPGTVSASIEAEKPGAEYNVKAGRFTILGIAAAQQEAIYGQSSSDLAGGMSRVAQVVSQTDYDSAKDSLTKDLTDTLAKEMQQKADGKTILEKAIAASTPEITSTAKVGDEASDFQMTVKIKDQAVAYTAADLNTFINDILQLQIASDKTVTIPSESDLVLDVKDTAYDKGQLNLTAKVNAKVSAKISESDIAKSVLGKKSSEAEKIVLVNKGIDHVAIGFSPSWWPKIIPNLTRGVKVQTEYINIETK